MRHLHFRGGDFFPCGLGKAELADGEAGFAGIGVFGANGWSEDAAGHGTGGIDFAETGFWMERGAGGFIGEGFKGFLIRLGVAEDAGFQVAGEAGCETLQIQTSAGGDGFGAAWVGQGHFGHRAAQALGVEWVDGEGSVAAGGAARAAGEMRTGAAGRVSEGGVDDLDQTGVLFANSLSVGLSIHLQIRRVPLPQHGGLSRC